MTQTQTAQPHLVHDHAEQTFGFEVGTGITDPAERLVLPVTTPAGVASLLVTGRTGRGKSVLLNHMLMSGEASPDVDVIRVHWDGRVPNELAELFEWRRYDLRRQQLTQSRERPTVVVADEAYGLFVGDTADFWFQLVREGRKLAIGLWAGLCFSWPQVRDWLPEIALQDIPGWPGVALYGGREWQIDPPTMR